MISSTYFSLLQQQTSLLSDKLFLHIDHRSLSYEQTYREVLSLTDVLPNNLENQVVGICFSSTLYQLLGFFAVQAKRGIPVLLHPSITDDDLSAFIRKNPISFLWKDPSRPPQIISSEFSLLSDYSHFSDACHGVLTSGSDGISKILFRSMESWSTFFPIQNQTFHLDRETNLFFSGSASFTGNLNLILGVLYAGGTVTGFSTFNPLSWISLFTNLRFFPPVNAIYLIPVKLRCLLRVLKNQKFSTIQSIISGSMLMYSETYYHLKATFPCSHITLYYGASELSYISFLSDEDIPAKPYSVGKPFPGISLYCLHHRIYVKSPYCAINFPTDRYITLNDHGYLDSDGDLIFEGRKGDIITRNGVQIVLSKIENTLTDLPEIENAFVFSLPDSMHGHTIYAFFSPTTHPANPDELCTRIRSLLTRKLMTQELPDRLIPLTAIPLTSSGKPDRLACMKLI